MTCHSCQFDWKVARLPLRVATSAWRCTSSSFRRRISTDSGERCAILLVWPPGPPQPWADPPQASLNSSSSACRVKMFVEGPAPILTYFTFTLLIHPVIWRLVSFDGLPWCSICMSVVVVFCLHIVYSPSLGQVVGMSF